MIRLEAATVMLQWAVGGLAFLWFTTRRNEGAKGLGLTLVFNLVSHVLQGEVSLHNSDTGCVVTLTCPLDLATA